MSGQKYFGLIVFRRIEHAQVNLTNQLYKTEIVHSSSVQ